MKKFFYLQDFAPAFFYPLLIFFLSLQLECNIMINLINLEFGA